MTACFYTVFDDFFKDVGQGLINSIKHFYPDVPVVVGEAPKKDGQFSLQNFCDYHIQKGLELLDDFDRVIFIDCDSLMCGKCDDLFGEFDLAVVQNNIPVGTSYGGISGLVYINNGMDVCTNKEVWMEYVNEYRSKTWETLSEQNALNMVAHNTKHLCKLLDFPDRTYGICEMSEYPKMYLKDGELYVPPKDSVFSPFPKKVKIFHAAGIDWKDNSVPRIKFERILDDEARNYMINLTK